MRLRNLIASVLAVAALALSGCGDADCADVQDVKETLLGPEEQTFIVPDTTRKQDVHYSIYLRCADGLTSVEVGATGTQADATSSYMLTEVIGTTSDHPDEKYQTGVKITARPPVNTKIVSSIVRTVGSSDVELRLSIGSGGAYEATIKSASYAYLPDFPWDYPVSSILFCIKQTS